MGTQTSEYGGLVYGLASEGDDAGEPVSAAVTRDHVVNGLLHQLDSSGQVMVNFAVVSADEIELADPPGPTEDPVLIPSLSFLLPNYQLRHGDASSFRLVVKMRASVSAAGTATFRLSLRPSNPRTIWSTPADPYASAFRPTNIVEVETSSTTGEDLEAVLYLTAGQTRVGGGWSSVPSVEFYVDPDTGVVSEVPGTALAYQVYFQIYALSTVPTARPRVLSMTAIAYPGEREET